MDPATYLGSGSGGSGGKPYYDLQRVALFVVKGEKREMAGQEKPYKRGTIQRCYSIKTNNRRIEMLGAIGERTHYLAEQRCEAAILKERARMAGPSQHPGPRIHGRYHADGSGGRSIARGKLKAAGLNCRSS